MKTYKLQNEVTCHRIKIASLFTGAIFANSLANHYYRSGQLFYHELKKRDAMKILKDELYFHGIKGEDWGEDNQQTEEINGIYQDAIEWVEKNYTNLKEI